jgi:hypothetical protein
MIQEFIQGKEFEEFLKQDLNYREEKYSMDQYRVDLNKSNCPYLKTVLMCMGIEEKVFYRRLDKYLDRAWIRTINSQKRKLKENFEIKEK